MIATQQHNRPVQKIGLKIAIALATLVLTLVLVNFSINKYETHLDNGNQVLLELAPVDPRALMQGDYMALDYAIADDIRAAMRQQKKLEANAPLYHYNSNGIAIIKKDANGVGQFVRIISPNALANTHLAINEMPLYYRMRHGEVKIATNAFFFQEGHGESYETAKYGLFRVNDKGEPLLANMVDENYEVIKPAITSSPK